MRSEWLVFIFLLLVIVAAVDIMRRAIVTIRYERHRRELQKAMRKLRRPHLPHVSVLVYAKRDTDAVDATLQSLKKNRYGAFDVVVVNDVLNKRTYSAPSRLDVKYLKRRIAGSKMDAYRAAYRKSRRGDVVLCIDAGDILDPFCIKRAVALAENQQQWRVSVEKESRHEGVNGVASSLYGLLWPHRTFVSAYRPQALRNTKDLRTTQQKIHLPKTILGGGLVAGAVLASFALGPAMVWYVWIVFSGYLLGLIWLKGGWSAPQKIFHSFAVPSALFLLPVTSFIEAVFQLGNRK